jgi:hypothetical protein
MEPLYDLPLGRNLSLRLGYLRFQASRVQPGHELAFAHALAFLHQHRSNPLAVVERELYLPQIYIPIEHKLTGIVLTPCQPPSQADSSRPDQD